MCIHNGFYFSHVSELQEIENPFISSDLESAFDTADVFLHGACNLFSKALAKRFGYLAYELYGCRNRLIHAFCIINCHGHIAFVDVRGITTKFEAFISEFAIDNNEKIGIRQQNIIEGIDEEAVGIRFAETVIDRYSKYYNPCYGAIK